MSPDYTSKLKIRFWQKVDLSDDHPNHCWHWKASTMQGGYGKIWYRGKLIAAHRISWMLANGEIPPGMDVLHECDNPKCVNPNHLFIGTHTINMQDKEKKGRGNHCGLSGEYNPAAKLTMEQAREIRKRYSKGGVSQLEIANEYGIDQTSIGKIVRNEAYKEEVDETKT